MKSDVAAKPVDVGKKGIKDFGAVVENPFAPEGIITGVRYVQGKQQEVVNTESGELILQSHMDKVVPLVRDTLPFVKVFMGSLEQNKRLSVPATRLLWYILQIIKPNRDTVTISINEFLDTSGYAGPAVGGEGKSGKRSTVHYYRAVTELLSEQYLCKKAGQDHTFFININKFFNGDRTKL